MCITKGLLYTFIRGEVNVQMVQLKENKVEISEECLFKHVSQNIIWIMHSSDISYSLL